MFNPKEIDINEIAMAFIENEDRKIDIAIDIVKNIYDVTNEDITRMYNDGVFYDIAHDMIVAMKKYI